MNRQFWRDRKVFVTLHGFKGGWLCLWLRRLVREWGLLVAAHGRALRTGACRRFGGQHGDIRERGKLAEAVARFAPDIVLHLAAQSVVLDAYADPVDTFSTNVVGTASVYRQRASIDRSMRSRERHDRQGVREPRLGVGVRDRQARWARSLLEQQSLRRARGECVPIPFSMLRVRPAGVSGLRVRVRAM